VLVVTTPEPTAITDAYAVIKVISKDGVDRRISLLVNQVRNASEAKQVHDRVAKVAKNFLGVNVLEAGHMVADDHVRRAVLQRMPFLLCSPKCGASFCITQLAMRFEQGISPAADGGFFNRMSKWFKKS
jgi:flagellar biosynthesis protein FlhG